MNLKGKTVLITGATGTAGVGFGCVQAVIEAGGQPIINGRSPGKLAEARERFPCAEVVQGDIANSSEVVKIFSELAERGLVVDGLVNNAGIGLHNAPHECGEEDFDRLVGVDFRGAWLVTREWLRAILGADGKARQPAACVNISSVHARKTMPGYGLYAATKGAVDSMTRSLAIHYGNCGVRFNGVAPGYVHSDQNMELLRNWTDDPSQWVEEVLAHHQAINRPIEPIDVGRVVAFLLSEASWAVSGQTLTVDAGNTNLLFPLNFV